MLTRTQRSLLSLCLLAPALPLWAQTPSGLAVKAATNKRVDLSWTGTASSYTVQRRTLGGSFANVATAVTTASYSDTTIDAFTTYQYQVLATGGTAASNQVTEGPPPAGFSVAAPTPATADPTSYGYNISVALDSNGDPAFVFLWNDPNKDTNLSDTQLLFRSWNRATYAWNAVVKVDTVGDSTSTYRATASLAYDSSTNTWGVAAEINGEAAVNLYLSTNGGATWTVKNSFKTTGSGTQGPSLALANGNVYLAYIVDSNGLKYVTGQVSAAASSWPIKTAPKPVGTDLATSGTSPSLALDSTGTPAVAYWVADLTPNESYNSILFFWRPNGTAAPVKVTDTQNSQSDVAATLRFAGTNPRIAFSAYRNDSDPDGDTIHFVRSDNGGSTWLAPVLIPKDGSGSSTDYPMDVALTSQGQGAIAFGQNGGTGNDACGYPKLSRSTDLTSWTTCAAADVSVTGNYDVYPNSIAAVFGANDKLYLFWAEAGNNGTGLGVLMWREPPASFVSGPVISDGGVVAHSSAQKFIVGGSWVDIYGTNFTDVSTTWSNADFSNGLPTTLGGVQVLMNNVPCAVAYVSPGQLVVQAPNATASTGNSVSVTVQVVHSGVPGNTVSISALAHEPSIFTYPGGSNQYPATLLSDNATLGDPAVVPGTRKARPGEAVTLWVTGLGVSPAGVAVNSVAPYGSPVTIPGLVGSDGNAVTASFAGLVAPGLFQVNFTVPATVTSNRQIQVSVTGGGSQTVTLPIGN